MLYWLNSLTLAVPMPTPYVKPHGRIPRRL